MKNTDAFLEEYDRLCRKYQLTVDACGCCQSPFIVSSNDSAINEAVEHLRKEAERLPVVIKL